MAHSRYALVVAALFFMGPIVSAEEMDNHFRFSTGVGLGIDSSANASFLFGADAHWELSPNFAIGPFFDLFLADGATTFTFSPAECDEIIVPCTTAQFRSVTLDTGGQFVIGAEVVNDLRLFVSAGVGYFHPWGGAHGMVFPVGLGGYLMGEFAGLGTAMTFNWTTVDDVHFVWNWRILSFLIQY